MEFDLSRRPFSDEPDDGGGAPPRSGVTAVLGPTNTGKTHFAIERMLTHRTGVIGLPLRLLAREVYDRLVMLRGDRDVALITGEEKIVPVDSRYFVCTVESMPLDWGADFVAVDEIQLCADPERGHVFTDRLLRARGRIETLLLGASTMSARIAALAPRTRFVSRDRLSTLRYTGERKISRLPERSAIVAFSTENVYAIAELIRRQKGGAAVVMGALSPRTRNAQVAMYQEGDVDYLIATDAIGMGLNLDVRHVAFAGLRKFDGRRHRELEPNELAQIAGRAGRHMSDGTFGVTGAAPALSPELAQAIEEHRFRTVERLQWRNADLDFATPETLIASLEREPPSRDLTRARESDDLATLRALARDQSIHAMAKGRPAVSLLWDVCQLPDFRKTMAGEHAALSGQLFRFLTGEAGVIPEDWIAAQCARLDRVDGDIDALSKRLAYIRTWTYAANRRRWLNDPAHWRGVTRDIEDKLSDALHERLTQRFVDRRTSVLARRLKQREKLVATVDDSGGVTVEGEFVGRLDGFRFQPDPNAAGAEVKTLQAAGAQALGAELARRAESFYNAPDTEIDVTEQGGLMWGSSAVGRLESRHSDGDPLAVRAVAFADEMLEPAIVEKIERRLQFWIDNKLKTVFEPLLAMRDDEAIVGLARGVAFQILERFGVAPRGEISDSVRQLDQEARGLLRKHGVRFGQFTIFIPALLKPAPTRFRLILWGLAHKLDEIPSPPPAGHVTIPVEPQAPAGYYPMVGYRRCGSRALRLDMLERLADMIRGLDAKGGFEATPQMLSITGATLEQFAEMMQGMGYVAEKGERPKPIRPARTDAEAQSDADAESGDVPAAAGSDAADGDAPANPNPATEVAETPADAPADAQAPTPEAAQTPEDEASADEPPKVEAAADESPTDAASADAAAAQETSSAGEAADDAAGTADRAEADGQPAAEGAAEVETFYVFRHAPKNRQPRGDRGRRQGNQGTQAGQSDGAKPRRHGKQGGERRGGEKDRGDQNSRAYASSGGKKSRERPIDPDNPFAVLQQLKEKR